jgi:hypothetical protein
MLNYEDEANGSSVNLIICCNFFSLNYNLLNLLFPNFNFKFSPTPSFRLFFTKGGLWSKATLRSRLKIGSTWVKAPRSAVKDGRYALHLKSERPTAHLKGERVKDEKREQIKNKVSLKSKNNQQEFII